MSVPAQLVYLIHKLFIKSVTSVYLLTASVFDYTVIHIRRQSIKVIRSNDRSKGLF